MMINKRLIGTVSKSKKYIAGNVTLQWCSLAANIVIMFCITGLLEGLYIGTVDSNSILLSAGVLLAALIVRYLCATGASRMGYLSSKEVKKTLREKIYQKLLRLGASYQEQVKTSEVVQVAVEGVDQLENLFWRLPASVFLQHAGAHHPVCHSELYQFPFGHCAAFVCAVDSCGHCGCSDVGKEAAVQILGSVHCLGRFLFGKIYRALLH